MAAVAANVNGGNILMNDGARRRSDLDCSSGAAPQATGTQLRRGVLWGTARSILLRTTGLLTMTVVVRIVSPEQFGVWAVALSVHAIVNSSAEVGVTAMLIRRDASVQALGSTAMTLAIASSSIMGAAMATTAPALAEAFGSSDATTVIRVLAIAVAASGFFAVPNALLARDFRQRALFGANLIAIITGNITLLSAAAAGAGALAFAWSILASQLAAGVAALRFAQPVQRPGFDRTAARTLLRFGAPLAAANAINYAYLNIDYVIVGRTLDAAALGIYLLAFNVASWPYAILGGTVNSVTMPAFSEGTASTRQQRVEVTVQLVGMVAFPMAAMLATLAGPVIGTLYGGEWIAAASILAILSPYGAIFVITLTLGNLLVGAGRPTSLLRLQVLWLVALAPTMWLCVRLIGLRGAAVAHLIVITTVAAPAYLRAVQHRTSIPVRAILRSLLAPALLSTIAAGIAAMASTIANAAPLRLAAGGAAGAVAYLVLAMPLIAARMTRRRDPVAAPSSLLGRIGTIGAASPLASLFLTHTERQRSQLRSAALGPSRLDH